MIPKHRVPNHPGEILFQEFLLPNGISQVEFAKKIGVPIQRINTLVNAHRGITAETALLLADALKTSPEFWMSLQAAYDLYQAKRLFRKAA